MKCLSLSLSLSFLLLPLELRVFVKRFVSLQFLNSKTVGRAPWTGDQAIARPLTSQDNTNAETTQTDIHASNAICTHDPSVQAAKTVHALEARPL
jgi:hypothetical protein